MYGNAPLVTATGVPGWLTENEQGLLIEAAGRVSATINDPVVLEVGCEFGGSTSIWCKFTPDTATIYSVDLFPGDLLAHHRGNLQQVGLLRSLQLQGESTEVEKDWRAGKFGLHDDIDLLFIDGDHSYAGVWRDIEAWVPHVVPSGIVIFHDYAQTLEPGKWHPLHYEVRKAVDEWFAAAEPNGWRYVARSDSAIEFRLDVKAIKKSQPVAEVETKPAVTEKAPVKKAAAAKKAVTVK